MKNKVILLLFVFLFSLFTSSVLAEDVFDVNVQVSVNDIYPTQTAKFYFTINNPTLEDDEYKLTFISSGKWSFSTDPSSYLSGVNVKAGEEVTFPVLIKASDAGVSYGMQSFPVVIKSKNSDVSKETSLQLLLRNPTPPLTNYLPSVGYTVDIADEIDPRESEKLKVHLSNKNSLNIKELTKVLIKGQKSGEEVEIKLIEGWNAVEMAEYLEKENIAEKKFFLEAVEDVKSFKEDFQFLSSIPSDKNLEGFLFPDTYRIYNNSEVEDIIRKMLKNFDKKLTQELRDEIQKQEKDLYEILTMASVIQKEVRSTKDMKVVSGIFWDRIKYGQPLESCATIGYILGESKIRYSFEDTKIDSPYNTYTNKGLPPGPIANPGLQAIEAAVYPEFTDYVYFLSKPNGETVFSITYEEHLSNSNKYLK